MGLISFGKYSEWESQEKCIFYLSLHEKQSTNKNLGPVNRTNIRNSLATLKSLSWFFSFQRSNWEDALIGMSITQFGEFGWAVSPVS